ncbi:MAG: tetratricopeptide repeat protein [Xanthobacteraceae bacterium]
MAALQAQRADEAERIAAEALTRDRHHPGALHVLGLALLAQGRARESATSFETASAITSDPVIETHWAIALRQCGEPARALEVLQRAVLREPPFPLAFHELGLVLFLLRRLNEAQAVLERGLKLAPAMVELSVLLGGILLDRGEWDSARVAFARALASAPRQPGALLGLGAALMGAGEFAAAAERLTQALARDPGYTQARLKLAACLLELQLEKEAIACLRTTVQRAPDSYAEALRTLISAGRGTFCLKPSGAAAMLKA